MAVIDSFTHFCSKLVESGLYFIQPFSISDKFRISTIELIFSYSSWFTCLVLKIFTFWNRKYLHVNYLMHFENIFGFPASLKWHWILKIFKDFRKHESPGWIWSDIGSFQKMATDQKHTPYLVNELWIFEHTDTVCRFS